MLAAHQADPLADDPGEGMKDLDRRGEAVYQLSMHITMTFEVLFCSFE